MDLMSYQSSTEDVDVQAHDVFTCSVCVDRQMELGQADYATYRWVEVADDYFFAVHGDCNICQQSCYEVEDILFSEGRGCRKIFHAGCADHRGGGEVTPV